MRTGTLHCKRTFTHRIIYAFTAWEGAFLTSNVVRQGYELNVPVLIATGAAATRSLFSISGADSVIIDTVNPAEAVGANPVIPHHSRQNRKTAI